jgi:hypothetical protein
LAWLVASPIGRAIAWIGAGLGIAAAAAIAIARMRSTARDAGRAEARAEQTEEIVDAQDRMLDAERDRPRGRDDVAGRMRNGRF